VNTLSWTEILLTGSEREIFNTAIVCIHALAEDRCEEHKDAFYDNLERLY
jgi:hypothetical protein